MTTTSTTTATLRAKIGATTAKANKLPTGASELIVRDAELRGFALRIYATGGKTYVYAGRVAGTGNAISIRLPMRYQFLGRFVGTHEAKDGSVLKHQGVARS